jgi:hypothetical protein
MPRFLLVRGRPGALVSDHRSDARRFLGVERIEAPEGVSLHQRYRPIAQLLVDHPHVRAAIAAGDLELVSGPVIAADESAAQSAMKPAPKKEK